jgi:hypothetical protein
MEKLPYNVSIFRQFTQLLLVLRSASSLTIPHKSASDELLRVNLTVPLLRDSDYILLVVLLYSTRGNKTIVCPLVPSSVRFLY